MTWTRRYLSKEDTGRRSSANPDVRKSIRRLPDGASSIQATAVLARAELFFSSERTQAALQSANAFLGLVLVSTVWADQFFLTLISRKVFSVRIRLRHEKREVFLPKPFVFGLTGHDRRKLAVDPGRDRLGEAIHPAIQIAVPFGTLILLGPKTS